MYFNFEIRFKKLTIWVAYVAMFRFTNVGRNMEMLTMTSQKNKKCQKIKECVIVICSNTLNYFKSYPRVQLCSLITLSIIHILHGFEGDTPEYLPRCDKKAYRAFLYQREKYSGIDAREDL